MNLISIREGKYYIRWSDIVRQNDFSLRAKFYPIDVYPLSFGFLSMDWDTLVFANLSMRPISYPLATRPVEQVISFIISNIGIGAELRGVLRGLYSDHHREHAIQ